jgi:hypothetical protein
MAKKIESKKKKRFAQKKTWLMFIFNQQKGLDLLARKEGLFEAD